MDELVEGANSLLIVRRLLATISMATSMQIELFDVEIRAWIELDAEQ